MRTCQSLPKLWLLSDERNDATLEQALDRLPFGSGFIFRHYHLPDQERLERFQTLRRRAQSRDCTVILADSALTAREWGADGIYGAPLALYPRRSDLLMIATAHNLAEIGQANRQDVDAIMLSAVFATQSHAGGPTLGPARFRQLARHASPPVIALGGMTQERAMALNWPRWAAIDGLS